MPCVMNAANEESANAFLRGEIPFLAIPEVVWRTMEAHTTTHVDLGAILEADQWARETSRVQMELV